VPRFYFDVFVGDDCTHDDVGFEYESLAVAESQASQAAAEIAGEALPKRRVSEVCVQVRDGDGVLVTIEISMAVSRTARA